MPFCYFNPYQVISGVTVLEMRYGRRRDVQKLTDSINPVAFV